MGMDGAAELALGARAPCGSHVLRNTPQCCTLIDSAVNAYYQSAEHQGGGAVPARERSVGSPLERFGPAPFAPSGAAPRTPLRAGRSSRVPRQTERPVAAGSTGSHLGERRRRACADSNPPPPHLRNGRRGLRLSVPFLAAGLGGGRARFFE